MGRYPCITHPALPPLTGSLHQKTPKKTKEPALISPRRTRPEGEMRGQDLECRGEKKRGFHHVTDSFDFDHLRTQDQSKKTVVPHLPTPSATSNPSKCERRVERRREFTTELMNANDKDKLRRGLLDFGLDLNDEGSTKNGVLDLVAEDPENPFLALSDPHFSRAAENGQAPEETNGEKQHPKTVDEHPWRNGVPVRDEENNPFLDTAPAAKTTTNNMQRVQPGHVAYVFRGKRVVYEDPNAFLMASNSAKMDDGSLQFQPKKLFQDLINSKDSQSKSPALTSDESTKRRRLS